MQVLGVDQTDGCAGAVQPLGDSPAKQVRAHGELVGDALVMASLKRLQSRRCAPATCALSHDN